MHDFSKTSLRCSLLMCVPSSRSYHDTDRYMNVRLYEVPCLARSSRVVRRRQNDDLVEQSIFGPRTSHMQDTNILNAEESQLVKEPIRRGTPGHFKDAGSNSTSAALYANAKTSSLPTHGSLDEGADKKRNITTLKDTREQADGADDHVHVSTQRHFDGCSRAATFGVNGGARYWRAHGHPAHSMHLTLWHHEDECGCITHPLTARIVLKK